MLTFDHNKKIKEISVVENLIIAIPIFFQFSAFATVALSFRTMREQIKINSHLVRSKSGSSTDMEKQLI